MWSREKLNIILNNLLICEWNRGSEMLIRCWYSRSAAHGKEFHVQLTPKQLDRDIEKFFC
jgi:hypothetical protein